MFTQLLCAIDVTKWSYSRRMKQKREGLLASCHILLNSLTLRIGILLVAAYLLRISILDSDRNRVADDKIGSLISYTLVLTVEFQTDFRHCQGSEDVCLEPETLFREPRNCVYPSCSPQVSNIEEETKRVDITARTILCFHCNLVPSRRIVVQLYKQSTMVLLDNFSGI